MESPPGALETEQPQAGSSGAAENGGPHAAAPAAPLPPQQRPLATVSVPPLSGLSPFGGAGLTPPVARRIRSETVSDTGQSAAGAASCAGEALIGASSADAPRGGGPAAAAAAAGGPTDGGASVGARGSCPGLEPRGSMTLGERAASSGDLPELAAAAAAADAAGSAGSALPPPDAAVTSGPLPRIRGLGVAAAAAGGGASGSNTPIGAGGGTSPFFRGAPQAGLAFASPAAAAGIGERPRERGRCGHWATSAAQP
jgi:hypothetical protein